MSKRIDQALSVIDKTAALVRAELKSTDCVPFKVAKSFCNKAITETAKQHHVNRSTVSSKCVREIGMKSTNDFFCSMVEFLTGQSDRLRNALLNHDCDDDGEWYINCMLDAML